MIVNPHTGRTFEHDSLLAELEDWTRQKPILEALIKNKVANFEGVMNLAAAIRFALEGRPEGLTPTQAAGAMIQMIGHERVRTKIARHCARKHGLTEWEAEEGLLQLADHVADMIPGGDDGH